METIAQEAKRLLEPIPEDKWIVGRFTDERGRCCARGHWARIHSENPNDYDSRNCEDYWNDELKAFVNLADDFVKKNDHSIAMQGLSAVNDGIVDAYPQSTPKQRVMALFSDMIAAGL